MAVTKNGVANSGVLANTYSGNLIAVGTGFNVSVAAHKVFMGMERITVAANSAVSVTPSVPNYIWAKYNGGTPLVVSTTIFSRPDSTTDHPAVFLGTAMAGASSVTSVDNTRTEVYPVEVEGSPFNVKAFGAVGDGAANDTTALQAAIDAASAAGRGVVFIPSGTYLTDYLTLASNLTIRGAGQGLTVLQMNANAATVPSSNPPLACVLYASSAVSNVTVEDLTLDGNMANNTSSRVVVSNLDGATDVKYHRVECKGGRGHAPTGGGDVVPGVGLSFGRTSSWVEVSDCYVHTLGVTNYASDAIYLSGSNLRVIGNRIENHTDTGIVLESVSQVETDPSSTSVIANNVIKSDAQGISVDSTLIGSPLHVTYGANVSITGNTIDGGAGSNGAQIFVYARGTGEQADISVVGNTLRDSISGKGILVNSAKRVVVSANTLYNTSPTLNEHGIAVVDSDGVIVDGNTVTGSGGCGITFQGSTNCSAIGNTATDNNVSISLTVSGIQVTKSSRGFTGLSMTMGSAVLTASSSSFYSNDVGRTVTVNGAGAGGTVLTATVTSYSSPTQITLTTNASTTVSLQTGTMSGQESSNISLIGNRSHGEHTLYGIAIGDVSDKILVALNDLRVNATGGYFNSSSGNVRRLFNLTSNTSNTPEAADYIDAVGGVTLSGVASGNTPYIKGTGANQIDLLAGSGGFRVLNNAGTVANFSVIDNGGAIVQGTLSVYGNELQFLNNGTGGLVPYVKHLSNNLDIKGGTSGTRILNNAGTFSNLILSDAGNATLRGSLAIGNGTAIAKHLSGTATWDPASVASGSFASTTVTVTGAAVGDTVTVGFSQAVPAGCVLSGAVTAASAVTVTLLNMSGSAVDLASGTLRADTWQH